MLSGEGKSKAKAAMTFAELAASGMATRDDATRWTTAAVLAWLWRRGCRAMAREVGLHPTKLLTTAWHGVWRVDVAAVERSQRGMRDIVHVVEVKGTRADLKREDRAKLGGLNHRKWSEPWHRKGLLPWIALGPGVKPGRVDLLTSYAADWGIVGVDVAGEVKVMKLPTGFQSMRKRGELPDVVDVAHAAIAQVNTAAALPAMAGADVTQMTRSIYGWGRS